METAFFRPLSKAVPSVFEIKFQNVVWTLNSSHEEHCKQMIMPGVAGRAELQASGHFPKSQMK